MTKIKLDKSLIKITCNLTESEKKAIEERVKADINAALDYKKSGDKEKLNKIIFYDVNNSFRAIKQSESFKQQEGMLCYNFMMIKAMDSLALRKKPKGSEEFYAQVFEEYREKKEGDMFFG